ncbi:MAG: septum formation protein Maf [Clostridia bacterium]|nr:septum formation protein Maf [Clostridia bacterium]
MKIILASGSPRRKEILEGLGVDFTVLSADADESCSIPYPEEYAMELARRKGQAAWAKIKQQLKEGIDNTDAVIISADTVVATDKEILGKPKDADDAYRMLRSLSGADHTVVTGIGITVGGVTSVSYCATLVRVAPIPDEEIRKYIASGDPFDKAGAYGIQGEFSKWIIGIDGCYFNVVGLPTYTLNRLFYEVTGEYI